MLDDLGEQYADLGFRQSDVEDYNIQQVEELKEELKQHAQLVLALIHHPMIAILKEHRERADSQEAAGIFEVPTGVWQHYKGTRYRMYGRAQSTDFHAPAVLYSVDGEVNGTIYTITLSNFYRTVTHNREKVNRFTKLSD